MSACVNWADEGHARCALGQGFSFLSFIDAEARVAQDKTVGHNICRIRASEWSRMDVQRLLSAAALSGPDGTEFTRHETKERSQARAKREGNK